MSLKLSIVSQAPLSLVADVLVIGVSEGVSTKEGVLAELEKALGPVVSRVAKREDFTGKKDQTLDLSTNDSLPAGRVLLVGLGKTSPLTDVEVRLLAAKGARFALGTKAESLAIVLPRGVAGGVRAAAEGAVLGSYRFTLFQTGDRLPKVNLAQVTLVLDEPVTQAHQDALVVGQRVGNAICVSRDLINTPPNELYPAMLVRAAVEVAQQCGLSAKVYDKQALINAGMNLFVAVGQGSAHDPHMAHLVYTPDKPAKKKVVFVGKGLTFDSGGLCIKPAPGMEEMKGDMGGAANVVGLMAAVAAAKPDVEVHGIIGAAENMPDGAAYRPADIFKSLDGKTVEIINTDAEGRLVLADCLAYARSLKPDLIVDNATLTGACVIALGTTVSGFFSNRDEVADQFRSAARSAGEAMWQLPLVEELREGLKSDWADLKHTADRWGGAISAALFLREFVGDTPWVHVDIAGPSTAAKPYGLYAKGGTGHGVLTYLRLIEQLAQSSS